MLIAAGLKVKLPSVDLEPLQAATIEVWLKAPAERRRVSARFNHGARRARGRWYSRFCNFPLALRALPATLCSNNRGKQAEEGHHAMNAAHVHTLPRCRRTEEQLTVVRAMPPLPNEEERAVRRMYARQRLPVDPRRSLTAASLHAALLRKLSVTVGRAQPEGMSAAAPTAYDPASLYRELVELQSDLSKTVAVCHSLRAENDAHVANYEKVWLAELRAPHHGLIVATCMALGLWPSCPLTLPPPSSRRS